MYLFLLFFGNSKGSPQNSGFFTSSSLAAVFISLWNLFTNKLKKTCEKIHKNPLHQKNKDRYKNASLTVEASLAFPVFFFAVLYLIQMFSVLRAEVAIAEAGITAAREVAAYSYAAERLTNGENILADKLSELFEPQILRDASVTAMFYVLCDTEILKEGKVAQGLGGIWVSTEEVEDKVQTNIQYRVAPVNVWTSEKGRYYVIRLIYRPWTGEGRRKGDGGQEKEGPLTHETVFITKHGKVYHRSRNCSYIKIEVRRVEADRVEEERNLSGAKYYRCEYCSPDKVQAVYVTEYGTRYHSVSSCSAIKREVQEVSLEEVKDTYRICSKCGKKEEEG